MMDILQTLARVNALLLQSAYQGAEHVLDSAIVEAQALIAERDALLAERDKLILDIAQSDYNFDAMSDELKSLRAEREQLLAQEPAIHIRDNGEVEYNPEYNGSIYGDFYAKAVPAQQVADPTNVWERAVIDAAQAVVRANQGNTGNEPSCSILARDIDALRDILDDNCLGYKPSPAVAVPDAVAERMTMLFDSINGDAYIGETEERHLVSQLKEWLSETSPSPRITEQDMREKAILEAIYKIESAHFRTVSDHGSSEHAQIVLGALRLMIGLPMVFEKDLPLWNGKKYAMPVDSNLIANQPALLNKLNAKPEGEQYGK